MRYTRRITNRAMGCAVGYAAVLLGAAALLAAQQQRSRAKMITYDIQFRQSEFTADEPIRLVVRLTNGTKTPVEVPDPAATSSQPTYTITGPGYPNGMRASRAGEAPATAPPADAPPPAMLTIEPNGQRAIQVPLNSMFDLHQAGEYRVTSEIAWNGQNLRAGPVAFRIVPLSISSLSLGVGVSPIGIAQGEIAFLRHAGDATYLYRARYLEDSPEVEEVQVRKPTPPARVGKDAADIAVPSSNGPFPAELLQWVVWRDGRRVWGLADTGDQVSMELAEAPALLVRPALKTAKGSVDALALSADRRHLTLVRFPNDPNDAERPPSQVWSEPLPAQAHGITAGLASVAQQSVRHVVFVASLQSGFEIYHSRYAANGHLEPFVSTHVGAGELVDGASPGLYIDEEGRAHVTVLAVSAARNAENSYRTVLAEAVFGPDNKAPEQPALSPVSKALPKPSDATILYHGAPGQPPQREVLLRAGGKLFRFTGSKLESFDPPGTVTSPIVMVAGKGAIYVLVITSDSGFQLIAL
jgi:hypothetical protein